MAPPIKTHCKRGHAMSGDNLHIRIKDGHTIRVCRTCRLDYQTARRRAAGVKDRSKHVSKPKAPKRTPRRKRDRPHVLDMLQPAELEARMQALRDRGYDDLAARAIITTQIKESTG